MSGEWRVLRGHPDDAELAALTVALLAVQSTAGAAEPPRARPSAWRDRAALTRRQQAPGPGAWRASRLPR